MKNRKLRFHMLILNAVLLVSSCQERSNVLVECLKDDVFYEITNFVDSMEIEIKLAKEDGSNKTLSKNYAYQENGEYYDSSSKRLFMSVKRDTAYNIIDYSRYPYKSNVYIGKTVNAPDTLPLTEFERRDNLFMSAFYSVEDGLFARYYFYDQNYKVLGVYSFIFGEYK